jgi:hypothetical protein
MYWVVLRWCQLVVAACPGSMAFIYLLCLALHWFDGATPDLADPVCVTTGGPECWRGGQAGDG